MAVASDTSRPAHGPVVEAAPRVDPVAAVAAVGSALVVFVWWIPRLSSSLVLDETLTGWITSDGLSDAWRRAYEFQGNSPLYFCVLWCWRQVAGDSELALRLPSMAAALAAAVLVYRLGQELRDTRAGAVAAFILVATAEVSVRGIYARPYAFELLLVVVSTWALIRWTSSSHVHHGAVWIGAAVAAMYMHPFAALLLVAHGTYLRVVTRRGGGPPRMALWVLGAIGGLTTLPLVPQLVSLAGRSEELSYASTPSVQTVVETIAPSAVIAAVGIGVLASRGWRRGAFDLDDPTLRLVVAWALLPPSVVYALSVVGDPVFVPRYLIFVVPATALVGACLLTGLSVNSGRLLAVTALVVLSVVALGDTPATTDQEWREAVRWAEQVSGTETVFVLSSGLVETRDVDRLDDPDWVDYLGGPVTHYARSAQPLELLPVGGAGDGSDHVEDVIAELSASRRRFVLLANTDHPTSAGYTAHFERVLTDGDWIAIPGPELDRVEVIAFDPR